MAASTGRTHSFARLTGAAGLVAALLFVVGAGWLQVAGLESIDADGVAIRDSVAENRTSMLGCYLLWNVAIMVQMVFFAGLSFECFRLGRTIHALVTGAAAAVLTGLMVVSYVFLGALAFRAPDVSPETAQLLSDLFYMGLSIAGLPGALVTLVPSLLMLRERGLPLLVALAGVASAAVHVEAAAALARSGAWSPAGWGGYVAPALFIAWMVGVAVLLLQSKQLMHPHHSSA